MEEKTEIRGACLSSEEQAELLRIARDALVTYVTEGKVPAETPAYPALSARGAAFVTLRSGGRLRGCIGYTEPHAPLYRTVQECIVAAATEDPRFPRVTAGEARNNFV